MEYPFDVKDVLISDPFILADPKTHRYYTYATMFNPDRYPGMRPAEGFYAICSEDLIHWSDPVKVFDRAETGFVVSDTSGTDRSGRRNAIYGKGATT